MESCNYKIILNFNDKEVLIDEYLDFLDELGNLRQKYKFIKTITIGD